MQQTDRISAADTDELSAVITGDALVKAELILAIGAQALALDTGQLC